MRVIYSPRYRIDLGLHVFPTRKYQLVHARLIETGVINPSSVVEPEPAGWDELALVHTPEYLADIRDGTMSVDDVARLELPWSAEMVEGFRLMAGGTIQAALIACGLEVRSLKSEVRSLKFVVARRLSRALSRAAIERSPPFFFVLPLEPRRSPLSSMGLK